MAVVYKAYQPALQRYVAIKVLPRNWGWTDFVKRFQHEAVAAARLKHPHIVTIHDGAADGVNYIVIGLSRRASPPSSGGGAAARRVARIVDQVASALDYAISGFVHRTSPSNGSRRGRSRHVDRHRIAKPWAARG
jgi:serine/threonine protein kinase